MRIAAAIIGGLIGLASIILAGVAYSASDTTRIVGAHDGMRGPSLLVGAGLLLCASAALAIEKPDASFIAALITAVAGLIAGMSSGWGWLVLPIVGAAATCLALSVQEENGKPATTIPDRWFNDVQH